MNRRNFLGMLSALPFVRGLSVPKVEPAIPVESHESPCVWRLVEIAINDRVYRAQSVEWSRGTTGRIDIRVNSVDGWLLPWRIGERVSLRMLKPEEFGWSWSCLLIGFQEDIEEGRRVTHVEFIADRKDESK